MNADEAYQKFSAVPLVKGLVDRASFCAGFDTCGEQFDPLLASVKSALQNSLPLLRKYIEEAGPCDHSVNICVCGVIHAAEQVSETLEALRNYENH